DYATALASAIESVPFPEKAVAFRRVLEEKPYWGGALAWAEVGHSWQLAPSASETPREAVVRAARCSTLLRQHPGRLDRSFVQEARNYFAAVGSRTEGDANLRGRFNTFFSAFAIENVYYAVMRDLGKPYRYYMKTPVDPNSRLVQVFLGFGEGSLH